MRIKIFRARVYVSSKVMCLLRSINSNQFLGNSVVTMVLNLIRCSVTMIVATVSMVTETMSVFDAKVEAGVMADKLGETHKRRGCVIEPEPLVNLLITGQWSL